MKKLFTLNLLIAFLLIGCGNENKEISEEEAYTNKPHAVTVLEKIDAKGYSYLQVSENDETYWIAVPQMEIEIGEKLYFTRSMEMKDFRSETIDRTFESLLFVEDARKSSDHPMTRENPHSTLSSVQKEEINIEPIQGGLTIGEIFVKAEELKGQKIKVKGKVVKYNQQIMQRNWIHIQDGTAEGENYDLVITSDDPAKVGDVIVAEGILSTNKDFGSGYVFNVIIESAKISKAI